MVIAAPAGKRRLGPDVATGCTTIGSKHPQRNIVAHDVIFTELDHGDGRVSAHEPHGLFKSAVGNISLIGITVDHEARAFSKMRRQ